MPGDLTFSSPESPDRGDIEIVDGGLEAFNEAAADLGSVRPLYVFCRDQREEIVGGVLARSWGAAAEIQIIWVAESRRCEGIGSRLLAEAEKAARARGCTLLYLDTFTFQAPPFYEKSGYQVRYVIEGFPGGVKKLHFSKPL